MHICTRVAVLLAIASNAIAKPIARQAAGGQTQPEEKTNTTIQLVPKRYILEFQPDTDVRGAVDKIASLQGSAIVRTFDNSLFKGVSVETADFNTDTLGAIDIVSQAWSSRRYTLGPITKNGFLAGGQNDLFKNYSIHQMTGVDKLHEAGLFGKGAQVAIVDTGIDYRHPGLGGGFGPGFKIAGGYDFVGQGTWPLPGQQKVPDNDPLDQQGHGTHVAGTVAGKADGFIGVAPEATLFAYKVFGSIDGTDEDTLIEAFLRAYDDGADIVTSSIGGVDGWTDGPWALVASRMVQQGVLVTISAGNDGQAGAYAASSGSSGYNALAIASVEADTIAIPTFKGTFNDKNMTQVKEIPFRTIQEWNATIVEGLPILPLLSGAVVTDACSDLPADTPSLSDKIVLIRRGGCTFVDKQFKLEPFNASYILIMNNDDPITGPGTQFDFSKLAMITKDDGESIARTVASGGKVTVSFKNLGFTGLANSDSPGAPSTFTSIGPTNDLSIKPDVAAPGGQIWSTYIGGGYASLSGTSMACPYVAGVAALYVGKFGGRKTHGPEWAATLAMRIISSGEALKWDDGTNSGKVYDFFASVAQVGTGIVNATKVLSYDTNLSLTKFALNDTAHLNRQNEISITNTGKSKVVYTFSQQPFGAFDSVNLDTSAFGAPKIGWYEEIMTKPRKIVPRMTCPDKVTVDPGATRKALCRFDTVTDGNPAAIPVYSGKTVITGSNGDVLGVPYLGLAADLRKDIKIMFQYPIGFPTIQSGPNNTDIAKKPTFSFDLSPAAGDFPRAYVRMQYATSELRWDIFDSTYTERQWSYPPKIGQAGYVGSATSWAKASGNAVFRPGVDSADELISLPIRNVHRDIAGVRGTDLWWLGRLANGTEIASGKYKMRFAALRPFGDPKKSIDWDVFQTPDITVTRR